MNPDHYLGRIVRLKKYAFRNMSNLNRRHSVGVQNCFLVAKVDPAMQELTCYGENLRITVSINDVTLI